MHPGMRILCCGALSVSFALPGSGVIAAPPGYDRDTRAYNLAHGRVVFTEHCLRCHEKGDKGAPIPGDSADWSSRLDQPLAVLIDHAIEGHGDMPARGETDLSNQDIASAVAYVVYRARIVLAEKSTTQPANKGAGVARLGDFDSVDDAVVQMFLLLMGKDRWK